MDTNVNAIERTRICQVRTGAHVKAGPVSQTSRNRSCSHHDKAASAHQLCNVKILSGGGVATAGTGNAGKQITKTRKTRIEPQASRSQPEPSVERLHVHPREQRLRIPRKHASASSVGLAKTFYNTFFKSPFPQTALDQVTNSLSQVPSATWNPRNP
jgi:hypothetical protein